MNMEAIFAVVDTTQAVLKIIPEKFRRAWNPWIFFRHYFHHCLISVQLTTKITSIFMAIFLVQDTKTIPHQQLFWEFSLKLLIIMVICSKGIGMLFEYPVMETRFTWCATLIVANSWLVLFPCTTSTIISVVVWSSSFFKLLTYWSSMCWREKLAITHWLF